VILAALLAVVIGCGSPPVTPILTAPFPKQLSAWGLFVGDLAELTPNEGVEPYRLNTPLFSDYADKDRHLWLPEGTTIPYAAEGVLQLPQGAVIAKTFSAPGTTRRIETRLMVHTASGWVGLPYVWDEAQQDATLRLAGATLALTFTTPSGESVALDYLVPDGNQCKGCHETKTDVMSPIGPSARQLNGPSPAEAGENQLVRLSRLGMLTGAPASPDDAPRAPVWDDPTTGDLNARARTYLDINCAHCHSPDGPGNTSGLHLGVEVAGDARALGLCKPPIAAGQGSGGRRFSIVPGEPEASILLHRLASTAPGERMPELGRALSHKEGVELVREWIDTMPGACETIPPTPG